jgi:hypothetical protein
MELVRLNYMGECSYLQQGPLFIGTALEINEKTRVHNQKHLENIFT